ncbi:MAG TPA: SEC-C metal-binding domain-containing protein, partial [Gemmataceae bacterium]
CPCGSGKKYKRCCYPRTFPDLSRPNSGLPSPFEEREAIYRALSRVEAQPPQIGHGTIDTVDVGRTRLLCAPLTPYGDGASLPGTLAPPTPLQIEAKYEEIRVTNPDGVTEVVVTYTCPEMFGQAEARMVFDADEEFRLLDGRAVSVLSLFRGMQAVMEDGNIGTIVGSPERRYGVPVPPLPEENGLWSSRVMGRVKHTAHEIVEFRWGGQMVRVTPGHAVWSASRRGWVGAHELYQGELIRVAGNVVAPAESVRRIPGMIEVFGIEVEYFHNYFVGIGDNAMLVHNGPEYLPKPVGVGKGHSYPEGVTSYAARKAHRTAVAEAKHSVHGYKHLKATTEAEAISFSAGKKAPAQYLPGIGNKGLEKIALEKGYIMEHGGGYHAFIRFERTVGYDGGKATSWIRAELSGGRYHGYPMHESRLPPEVIAHFGL